MLAGGENGRKEIESFLTQATNGILEAVYCANGLGVRLKDVLNGSRESNPMRVYIGYFMPIDSPPQVVNSE